MDDCLQEIARDFFADGSARTSLIAELARVLPAAPIDVVLRAITSNRRIVRQCAFGVLKRRATEVSRRHLSGVLEDADRQHQVLRALGGIPRELWLPSGDAGATEQKLWALTSDDSVPVRQAAAELLTKAFPGSVPKLVEQCSHRNDPGLSRVLCLHAPAAAVEMLAEQYARARARGDRPVPLAGLALTPERLAELWQRDVATARLLAVDFGYLREDQESEPDSAAAAVFEAGLWFCDPSMAQDPEEAVRRVGELCWYLVGRACASTALRVPSFRPELAADRSLLMAAARKLDAENLDARRTAGPFEHVDALQRAVLLAHSPCRLVEQKLFDEPLELLQPWGLTNEQTGQAILDYACLQTDNDGDLQLESLLFFRARYHVAARTGLVPDEVRTDRGSRRLREASVLVRPYPPVDRLSPHAELSPGARAVRQFAWTFCDADLTEQLLENERAGRGRLLPIGVEVQIPSVPPDLHVAWKESLRAAGIPSPRRPECGSMLEAAFPPSASFHAPIEFLRCLERIGVLTEPQDLGIHVSLQGNLGDCARFLAFVQMMLNTGVDRGDRPASPPRLVMSKGLVCLNSDITRCWWHDGSPHRTELRTFRLAANAAEDGAIRLDENGLRGIEETHLLASAILSSDPKAARVFGRFCEEVEQLVATGPPELSRLLEANFYESTGDYRDDSLLEELPISRLRAAAAQCSTRAQLLKRFLLSELDLCRSRHAAEVARLMEIPL